MTQAPLNSSPSNFVRINDPGPAAGLIGRYNFDNRISARVGLNYGYVYADDSDSNNAFERSRNLNFKSHIIDFTGGFEFNFFPYTHGSRFENYTPYLLAGFSFISEFSKINTLPNP